MDDKPVFTPILGFNSKPVPIVNKYPSVTNKQVPIIGERVPIINKQVSIIDKQVPIIGERVSNVTKTNIDSIITVKKDTKTFVVPIVGQNSQTSQNIQTSQNNQNLTLDIGYHKFLKERSKELKKNQPQLDGDERLKICRDEWKEIKSKNGGEASTNRELTSDYHKFMSTRMKDIKKSDPSIKHKDAFKQSAFEWTSNKLSEKESVVTEDNDKKKKINYYSKYLSEYVPIYRKMNPKMKHTDSFKLCVSKWEEVKSEYIKDYNKKNNIVDEKATKIKNIDISTYRPPTIVNNSTFTPPINMKSNVQPIAKVVPIQTNVIHNINNVNSIYSLNKVNIIPVKN